MVELSGDTSVVPLRHSYPDSRENRGLAVDDLHDSTPPDALRCPFCASSNIRSVGTPLPGRLDSEVLIVCVACDGVFIVPAVRA